MRRQKKNEKGASVAYISQKQAMRRLQLGLSNFRRICILKGIYPVEPKNKKKANRGNSQPKIYFHEKDIAFLAREPLIETFRKLRVHQKRLKKAREKLDMDKEYRIRMNKPTYTLHELVRERYPTREDALRDLTDSLNLIFLFSRLPRLSQFHPALISICKRFSVEFLLYVIATRSIRKAFISIKGFFLEAEINEMPVVWVIPHQVTSHTPADVDYRLLATCVEFDVTLVGCLLSSLYQQAGLLYPPELKSQNVEDPLSYCTRQNATFEFLASFTMPIKQLERDNIDPVQLDDLPELQTIDDSITVAVNKQIQTQRIKHLFDGKRFFLNREAPKEVLTVIIRSCGGDCSWDVASGPGASYTEDDDRIDYQVVDRPMKNMKSTRAYIQPQWVFDSLNSSRLLPTQDYLPSASLPPHLSPFATSLIVDPQTAMAEALKQAATISTAPGFGVGSALYRPPEADYLAGLVSLAEVRGAAVVSAKTSGFAANNKRQQETSNVEDQMEVIEKGERDSRKSKKNKQSVTKALKKGKQAIVKPGQALDQLTIRMAERAEENAQRKLREMMLPKRHKNLYKKMVHSQKTANKDMRILSERRKTIEENNAKTT